VRVLVAPDKMRGTLDASHFADAIGRALLAHGHEVDRVALSDGGEGFVDCFGGEVHHAEVTGPLGEPIGASFRLLEDGTAIVEMASAAGRALLPHPTGDHAISATTAGVGQLILGAINAGATTVVVGCGGSATTDGGRGAVGVLEAAGGLGSTRLLAATDVTTGFLDAARLFGAQKGASPAQIELLSRRLDEEAAAYQARYGLDVTVLARAGAAGGLAGGLAALGAELCSGFELVAERQGLDEVITHAELCVSGEGSLDVTTLEGKVVAALLGRLAPSCPVLLICGSAEEASLAALRSSRSGSVLCADLTARYGHTASTDTERLVEEATGRLLDEGGFA